MRQNETTYKIIIFFLILFLIPTVVGTILRLSGPRDPLERESLNNPNKEFSLNNKLYFYDNDKLFYVYKCENKVCGYINTILDDEKYNINYYKDGKDKNMAHYNEVFGLFQDGKKTKLYSFKINKTLLTFDGVKNYNSKLENNIVLVNVNNKWGVFSLQNYQKVIDTNYDYLGLSNKLNDQGEIITDKLIASKDNKWFILGIDNELKSVGINSIIKDYNSNYIITKDNTIYDYKGNYIYKENIKELFIIGQYLIIVDYSNNANFYKNIYGNSIVNYNVGDYGTLEFRYVDKKSNVVAIYKDGVYLTNIALY